MTQQPGFLDAPVLDAGVTRFWLVRHALVEENARLRLYGVLDVPLCEDSLVAQAPMYRALAARLPQDAAWLVTPLSRTQRTAQAIQEAGLQIGRDPVPWTVEPRFIEQSMGDWHGLAHEALPERLSLPAHQFWSIAAEEQPPGGESMVQVCGRVAEALEELAARNAGRDMVVVSHGGAIRAAVAHALGCSAHTALHFSVQNLSVTILERFPDAWRVVAVNELPGI
jgi:alpha-ribazole phosphatase